MAILFCRQYFAQYWITQLCKFWRYTYDGFKRIGMLLQQAGNFCIGVDSYHFICLTVFHFQRLWKQDIIFKMNVQMQIFFKFIQYPVQ